MPMPVPTSTTVSAAHSRLLRDMNERLGAGGSSTATVTERSCGGGMLAVANPRLLVRIVDPGRKGEGCFGSTRYNFLCEGRPAFEHPHRNARPKWQGG